MSTISSIASQPSVELLVERSLEVERRPMLDLEDEKSIMSKRLAIFNDLTTTLTALRDRVKKYGSVVDSPLAASRSAVSSNPDIFTAEVENTAQIGVNSIFVERLATHDSAISKKYNDPSTSTVLAAALNGTTQTFRISTGSGTPVEISIEFNDANETDESVLKRIRDAINNSGVEVTATYLMDTPTSARLNIVSNETGSENAVTLENVGSSTLMRVLRYLKADGTRKLYGGGTGGGYIIANTAKLDAKFTFNGINVIRGTNTVSDILDGVTISLKGVQEEGSAAETLTVEIDSSSLKAEIQKFIEDYNKAIKYLNEKSNIDSKTFERGPLAGDYNIVNLRFQLRNAVSRPVTDLEPGVLTMLSSIGIDLNRDGEMSIEDEDKLTVALESNANQVIDMFSSSNGIAQKVETILDRYVKLGGVLDNNKKGLNNKIDYIKSRIDSYEERLAIRATLLRRQFADLQRSLSALTSQQSMLTSINSFNVSGYQF